MIKLKDILTEWNDTSFKDLPKRWSGNGLTEFEKQGGKDLKEYGKKTSELVGTPKKVFGVVYDMKKEMAEGKFEPDNPSIHIQGFGVWSLKTLEKSIARDLKDCIN